MKHMNLIASVIVSMVFSNIAFASYADDRAEIENLSNRYMVAVDAGDLDTVMKTWVDDGDLIWANGTEHGKAAIRKAMTGFSESRIKGIPKGATSWPRSRHFILNHVIDVNGDTATTIAYWFEITNSTPQKDVQLVYFGHYGISWSDAAAIGCSRRERYTTNLCPIAPSSIRAWARRICANHEAVLSVFPPDRSPTRRYLA